MTELERTSCLYGIRGRLEVDDLLSRIPPLGAFECEMTLKQHVFAIQSQYNQIERAYIAAADLLEEIQGHRPPNSVMSGTYLSDNVQSELPIVFDTGASLSVTPVLEDFVTPLEDAKIGQMTGLADSVRIAGIGWVEWTIRDVFGKSHTIRTEAYYIKQASIRLFSPQTYFQENKEGLGKAEFDRSLLAFTLHDGSRLQFPYHPASNLPFMHLDWDVPQAGFTL